MQSLQNRQSNPMSYFSNALSQVLEQRYEGKQMALASQAGMQTSDISRLVREEAPLTGNKLAKLLRAEGMTENDKHLLTQSAVRDFVGEDAYRAWFVQPQAESIIREELGGPRFEGLFPLNPRAEQVIRYIVNHAHEPDTSTALELLGRFLELPEP